MQNDCTQLREYIATCTCTVWDQARRGYSPQKIAPRGDTAMSTAVRGRSMRMRKAGARGGSILRWTLSLLGDLGSTQHAAYSLLHGICRAHCVTHAMCRLSRMSISCCYLTRARVCRVAHGRHVAPRVHVSRTSRAAHVQGSASCTVLSTLVANRNCDFTAQH